MATDHNFKVKKGLDVLGGDVNLGDGFAYKIDGTTVVDSSRNLSNIGTISSGNITSSGNVTISGNLTVNGTQTTLNTATLQVEDKNIVLNYGSGDTSGSANGAGITIQDAVNSTTDATILWDTTYDEFGFSHPISVVGNSTFTGSATDTTSAATFKNSSGTVILRARNDGRVLIPSGYLYAQHSDGAYFTGSIKARGGITNDGGNNLSISSGGTDITFNSKNFTSVGTISSGAITSSGLTVDYTGNRTGDAGILVTNDASDWGIKVHKDSGADYGILSQTDGENAIVVRNAAGVVKAQLQGDGDATFQGTLTSGAITSTGVSSFGSGTTVGSVELDGAAIGNQEAGLNFQPNSAYRCIHPISMTATSHSSDISLGWSNNKWKDIYLAGYVKADSGYQIGTTTVIDSSRNLTNIGTISSGAITSTGTSSFAALNVSGDIDVTNGKITAGESGHSSSTGVLELGASTSSGWGTTTKYPYIGSDGTGVSLVMIQNPHVPYRTDNVRSGASGRAGLRMARNAAGSWWDMGLIGDEWELYRNGTGQLLHVNNAGNLSVTGTISSGAITATGRSTFDSITIDDDGSSSPLLRISADDGAPWALQLYREDLSAGPQVFASSGNTFSWQGHMDIRSGFDLKMNTTTVIDSSRNLTNIGTITATGAITTSAALTADTVLGRNTGMAGEDYLFGITEFDNDDSIRHKFDVEGNSNFTKVTDGTAPAPGVFQVNGYQNVQWGPYIPIDDDTEIVFETWAKYISGGDNSGNFYAGGHFYDANLTSLGNNSRYWGASGQSFDSDSGHSDWKHIKGVLKGSAIRGQTNTSTAKFVRFLILFNYSASANTTRYCGFKYYSSRKTITSLYHKKANHTGDYDITGFGASYVGGDTNDVIEVINNAGNIRVPGDLLVGTSSTSSGYRLNLGGNMNMNNTHIHYANEVHFNSGTRFKTLNTSTTLHRSNHASVSRMALDTNGTIRGYVAGNSDSGHSIGFLDQGGSWAVRHINDQGTIFYADGGSQQAAIGADLVSGSFGSMVVNETKSGWLGYSLNNRVVLMHDNANTSGLYNDVNNHWLVKTVNGGDTSLYHNGTRKLQTTSGGVLITTGNLQRETHNSGHLEGGHINIGSTAAKTSPIYTIGSSYNPTDSALSNMYGIGFGHSGNGSFLTSVSALTQGTSGWGQYVASDGDARIFLNAEEGTILSTGQHYAAGSLVWNAGNDGDGSGLDAGLLQGYDWGNWDKTVGARNLNIDAGNGHGLRFWNGNTDYQITMAASNTTGYGRQAYEPNSDYNMYFRMNGGTNRGFVFQDGTSNKVGIDSLGNIRADGVISSNNKQAMNVAHWSNSGTSTGAIVITLPGTTGNYSMPIIEVVTYEYNGDAHTVYHISGHNWQTGSNWYNNRVTATGANPKEVRLGHDGTTHCIVIGTTSESWAYGHVTVSLKAHPGFYATGQNMTTGWGISQITSLSGYSTTAQGVNKVWHSSNDGAGSGLDADLLDGLNLHTGRNNEVNKVVRTDSNGYIQAGWINTTSGNEGTTSFDRIYASYDGYIRYYTKANFGSQISSHINYNNIQNKPTIPTNNNQLTNGAGYAPAANPTFTGTITNAGTITTGSAQHRMNTPSGYIEIGPKNTSWGHIYTDRPNFYFNKQLYVLGDKVWNAGNDGTGSGLDADTVDGIQGASILRKDTSNDVGTYSNRTRWYSNTNLATATSTQASLECYSSGAGNDAFMTFHVGGDYACYFGLDGGTNKLSVGGWSMGANSFEIYHSGNKPSLATLGYTGATNANYITNNNQLTNGAGYQTTSGSVAQSHYVSGSAFATTGSPGSVLEYQQASGQTDTKLAPSTDWHNTIRMGHGNPYSYYSNTLAMQMTGTGTGRIRTQTISNNSALGWREVWDSGNDGSGSGLDADMLDSIQSTGFMQTGRTFTGSPDSINNGGDRYDPHSANPTNHHYAILTYGNGSNVTGQFATHFQSGESFTRAYNNSWSSWRKQWDASNDGPGTGLDADTVDGIQAASTLHKLNNTGYYRPNNWIDFRDASGSGLYWGAGTGSGWHIHPVSTAIMRFRSGSGTQSYLELNTTGTARGYVYANNSNEVGFLNNSQSWRLKCVAGGSVYMGGTQQMRINSSSTTGILEATSTHLVLRASGGGAISFQKSGGTVLAEITNGGNYSNVDGHSTFKRTANAPVIIDRLGTTGSSGTSNGEILNFRTVGTKRANIGYNVPYGTRFHIGFNTGGFGLQFYNFSSSMYIAPSNQDGSNKDNLVDLGSSGSRFDDVYATNGTIQTSDRNEKQDIQALTDAETRVATACKGLIRRFRWVDSVQTKGDDARYHFGAIAQDVEDAFTAEGLNAGDYALFIKNHWWEHEGASYPTAEAAPSGAVEKVRRGIRYNQLLAFIISAL